MKFLISLLLFVFLFSQCINAQTNSTCFGIPASNTSFVCSGNGNCTATDTCSCNTGFSEVKCDFFTCGGIAKNATNVCSGNGTCTTLDTCACRDGFGGATCNAFTCNNVAKNDSKVCSARGNCVGPDTCVCNTGVFGHVCEAFNCFSVLFNSTNVCSGKGSCLKPDNCTCQTGYSGNNCQNFQCFGIEHTNTTDVCSGNGNCTQPDKCSCKMGYTGNQCNAFKCFGVASNATGVCGGKGKCTGPDTCQCENGYSGNNCDSWRCGNVLKNDTARVCSGNGTCIASNNCTCKTGYNGTVCQSYRCSQVEFNSPNVCSGNGTCTSPNICACNTGFDGGNCNNYKCNGINFNSPTVCKGNGSCVAPNQCLCKTGFTGSNCEGYQCFGINYNSAAACNGNGACHAPNQCLCNTGYSAAECNIFKCAQDSIYNASAVTAQFSPTGLSVEFDFTISLEQSSIDACNGAVSNITSSTLLGTGATCTFPTTSTMRITLGTGSTLKVGNVIGFKKGVMKIRGCPVTLSGNVINKAGNPRAAFSSIKAPSTISSCVTDSLVMDGSSSTGSGTLRYKWSMVKKSGTNDKFDAVLNATLSAITANRVTVENVKLPTGAGTLTFRLTIIDSLGQTQSSEVSIVKSNTDTQIKVLIGRFPQDLARIDLDTNLVSTVQRSSCTNGTTSLTYAWTSTPSLTIVGDKKAVGTIRKYSMTVGTKYTISCSVELKSGTTTLSTAVATYVITGGSASVESSLAGQTFVILKSTEKVSLDASASRDNNIANGVNANAKFSWTCCEIHPTTSQCEQAKCLAKFTGLSANTANTFKSTANSTSVGTYRFTVTYTADTRSDSASKDIRVVPAANPIVTAQIVRTTCDRALVIANAQNFAGKVNFTQVVTAGSVKILGQPIFQDTRVVYLLDTSLTKSKTILRITGKLANQTASTDVILAVAELPSGGSVVITDVNGNAVNGSLKGDTSYNLIVKDFATPSGKTIFSRALIEFTDSNKRVQARVFNTDANTRLFKTPLDLSGSINAVAQLNLRTTERCSEVTSSISFTVAQGQLPVGETVDTLAEKRESEVVNALRDGTPSDVANAVSDVLSILRQGTGNSTARSLLKAKVLGSFKTSLLTAEVTPETRAAGLSIVADGISDITEISSVARQESVAILTSLFATAPNSTEVLAISSTVADSAVSNCAALLASLNYVPPTVNKTLLNYPDFLAAANTEFISIRGIVKKVVISAMVNLATGASYTSVATTLNVTGVKSGSTSLSASYNPFADGSLVVQPPSLPTGVSDVVNVLFFRYQKSFYKGAANFARISTDVYGIDVTDDKGADVKITGATKAAVIRMDSTTRTTDAGTNQCTFYNTVSGKFEPVKFLKALAGKWVECESNHLTDFAAFNTDAPKPTPKPTQTPRISSAVSVKLGSSILLIAILSVMFF